MRKQNRVKFLKVLREQNMSLRNLQEDIEDMFPDNPIAWSTLSQIRNGKTMNEFTLYRICKALECSPNDVLDF